MTLLLSDDLFCKPECVDCIHKLLKEVECPERILRTVPKLSGRREGQRGRDYLLMIPYDILNGLFFLKIIEIRGNRDVKEKWKL